MEKPSFLCHLQELKIKIYDKLNAELKGNVAIKISTGELGGHNYLKPDLIKDFTFVPNPAENIIKITPISDIYVIK